MWRALNTNKQQRGESKQLQVNQAGGSKLHLCFQLIYVACSEHATKKSITVILPEHHLRPILLHYDAHATNFSQTHMPLYTLAHKIP